MFRVNNLAASIGIAPGEKARRKHNCPWPVASGSRSQGVSNISEMTVQFRVKRLSIFE